MLSHDMHQEFPNLAEKIDVLAQTNTHFSHLYDQYNGLDAEIVKVEEDGMPIDDFAFENLKKKRLKLKDELYQILKEAHP